MAEIENLKIGSGGTIHIVGNEDIVAEAWAVGQNYVKDKSYVINNHILYVCNTSHTSVSPFDPTNWTQITVGESLTSLLDAINEVIATSKLNPVYGNTASGAIATFDTSLALPLQDCTIAINAVQTGTLPPSPSNVCPISGFTGANIRDVGSNLWDEKWESGSISSSTGENTTGTGIRAKNYIPVKEDVIYYPCLNAELQTNATNIQTRFYDANKNYIGSDNYWGKTVLWNSNTTERTLRVPVGARFMRFAVQPVYGSTYSDSNRISINYPNTDTAYHAYNPNSTTTAISWQDEAGTVYGGSLDVTSGKLTVTHGFKTYTGASGEIWVQHAVIANCFFIDNSLNNAYLNNAEHNYAITNMFVQKNYNQIASLADGEFCLGLGTGNAQRLAFKYTDVATLADWKTWLSSNNLTIVFKLSTPVTYQLTPTQISAIVGTNNVFTDTNGNTSVVYACSLKDYIDSQ